MAKAKNGQVENQDPIKEGAEDVSPAPQDDATTGLEDIAGALADQAPEINQGVIDAEALDREAAATPTFTRVTPPPYSNAPQSSYSGAAQPRRSREKVTFDASVHEVDENGQPVLTATGRFKRKPGTRRVNIPQQGQNQQPSPIDQIAQGKAQNAATAAMATQLKEALTISLISKEWLLTPEERMAETGALASSLDRYAPMGAPMNPLVVYATLVAVHAGKRFNQPETQTWLSRVKTRAAGWWIARKLKIKGKANAAQSDSRSDNVGKDNSSDTTPQQ